jgi:hypothetical protein
MNICAEGCYKHYVAGLGWVCCKCGSFQRDPKPVAAALDVGVR